MSKYRKKPVVIDAVKVHKDMTTVDIASELEVPLNSKCPISFEGDGNYIYTLEGKMKVNVGDYIIKGVQGEFYPCKPDIFESTYEIVEE